MRAATILCVLVLLQSFTSVQSVTYPILVGMFSFLSHRSKLSRIGYYLLDLFGTDPNDFSALTSFWDITSPRTTTASRTGYCGTIILMGGTALLGPNTIIQRTYTGLPAHTYISYALRAVNINQWATTSDTITFFIDGIVTQTLHPRTDTSSTSQGDCGNTNKDFIWYDIAGVQTHSSSSITLNYVISNTGYATASYGLHNLNILFRAVTPYYTNKICYDMVASLSSACGTDGNHYKTIGGSTQTCDSSCDMCFGPGSSGCFACRMNYYFDSTDCLPCSFNCATCTGTAANQCTRCNPPLILQPDNTCTNAACASPYILDAIGDHKKCILNPCQTNKYIFYNVSGQITCVQNCSYPYTVKDTIYCVPCTNSQYRAYDSQGQLYCSSNCTSPYQVKNTIYCLLCNLNEYILYDASGQLVCTSNCTSSPYQVRNTIYCLLCNLNEYILYDASGQLVCTSSCTSPYQVKNTIYCILPNSTSSTYSVQTNNQNNIIQKFISLSRSLAKVMASFLILSTPENLAGFYIGVFIHMLKYLRYLEIQYPSRLQHILDSEDDFSLSLNAPEVFRDPVEQTPPAKFGQYGLDARFLVNYWGCLVVLATLLVAVGCNCLLKRYAGNSQKIQRICDKVNASLKWNFPLTSFFFYSENMIISTSLELRMLHLHSMQGGLSFLVCLLINALSVLILGRTARIIYYLRKAYQESDLVERASQVHAVKELYKDFKIIYENIKDTSLIQQASMCIFIIYTYIFYFVVAYIFYYPLYQAIIHMLTTLLFTAYLLICRPLKKRTDEFTLVFLALIMLTITASVFGLAVLDAKRIEVLDLREKLGDVIIYANIVNNIFSLVSMGASLLLNVYRVYKWARNKCAARRREKTVPERTASNQLTSLRLSQSQAFSHSKISLKPRSQVPSQLIYQNQSPRIDPVDSSQIFLKHQEQHSLRQLLRNQRINQRLMSRQSVNTQAERVDSIHLTQFNDASYQRELLADRNTHNELNPTKNVLIQMQQRRKKAERL